VSSSDWATSLLLEEGGSLGTVCIYQGTDPEVTRRHADVADLPVDEILPVADTVIVREVSPFRASTAVRPLDR
jgi:hypothetical protein